MAIDDIPAGEWGTLQFTMPDFLEDVRDTINDVADLLLTFLDIAMAALQIVKAFAKSYLDPISALVQAIVDLVKQSIDAIKALGIYITGDWGLLEYPFEDLKGGFPEYERRMLSRLTDRSDPTRPDIPSTVSVLAVFFYLSVDISNIQRAIEFVQQILSTFNLRFDPQGTPPTPSVTGIAYGADVRSFRSLDDPNPYDDTPPRKVRISWKVDPTSTRSAFDPFPAAGPSGFKITISTVEDGIKLYYNRPEGNTDTQETDSGDKAQPREYGEVRDSLGRPVTIYGGRDEVDAINNLSYNKAIEKEGKFKHGKSAIYGVLSPADSTIIPISHVDLKVDGEGGGVTEVSHFYGRTFWYDNGGITADWASDEYSIILDLDDLPNKAIPETQADGKVVLKDLGKADTYYVRIQSVTSSGVAAFGVAAVENDNKTFPLAFDFSDAQTLMEAHAPVKIAYDKGRTPSTHSAWSSSRLLTFPQAHTKEYLRAVQNALVVLALSRSDLPLLADLSDQGVLAEAAKDKKVLIPNVALLPTGLEGFQHLLTFMYQEFDKEFEKPSQDPVEFRERLFDAALKVANDIYKRTGPQPDVEEFVVNSTVSLRTTSMAKIVLASDGPMSTKIPSRYVKIPLQGYVDTSTAPALADLQARYDKTNKESSITFKLKAEAAAANGWIPPVKQPPLTISPKDFEDLHLPAAEGDFGFAPNIYSMGVPAKDVDALFYTDLVRGRGPDFIEVREGGEDATFVLQSSVAAEDVPALLVVAPPGLQMIYEKYVREDGSILVPSDVAVYVNSLVAIGKKVGSGDKTPVFYVSRPNLLGAADKGLSDESGVFGGGVSQEGNVTSFEGSQTNAANIWFARTLFRNYENGILYDESRVALGLAASAITRPAQDGEWVAIRAFDAFPELDTFFSSVSSWMDSLNLAIQSVADSLIEYIEYVEARITEIQQLIRKINASIQSVLQFSVNIPKCGGLLLVGKGTDGITAGLTNATNKPTDTPLAYGAGVALLIPTVPTFFLDLIQALEGGQDIDANMTINQPPPTVGIEAIPPGAGPAPTDEPDVL